MIRTEVYHLHNPETMIIGIQQDDIAEHNFINISHEEAIELHTQLGEMLKCDFLSDCPCFENGRLDGINDIRSGDWR